jgi:amino acid adenylation domain-containing protein
MAPNSRSTTIRELVAQAARLEADVPFLVDPETQDTLTFSDLEQRSNILSAFLSQQGMEFQDKVAFLMDSGLITAQLFLAAMYSGFVVVPLNIRAGGVQLSYMLDHCDAKVVVVEEQYRELLQEAISNVGRPICVIAASRIGSAGDAQLSPAAMPAHTPRPDDVALLMYSSGSTGQPKAAIHTHSSVLAGGRNAVASHELTSADRSLLVLPLYHINAECVTLIPALLSGGSVVVPSRFSVSQFWNWIDDYRCTWSALVPTIISELVNWNDPRAGQREEAFRRIRFLRSSSAPLAPSLHREFVDKFQLPLLQAMGSTEGGNVFSNPIPPRKNKIGSPGLPWGFETRIVDRNGAEVPAGESGEVLLRGPALMRAYYKDPEGTAAVLDSNGWLHTGDLAYRDEEGYFFVVGRSKELVIKGGVNIAPRQIDEVLESHPAVLEAAAVGIPDRYLGEDLVAFVVLRSGESSDEHELLSFCETRLGHFKTPAWIRFAKELPKGPSGKVQRLKLVDTALAANLSVGGRNGNALALAANLPNGAIEETIAAAWAEILAIPKVDANSNFFALGGHSLLAIQCVSRLREKLPAPLTLSDFFEHGTVAEQAALIRERLHSGEGAVVSSDNWENGLPRKPAPSESIPLRDPSSPSPLSPAQERIWFLEQLNLGVPVYNEAEAVRLRGDLNVSAVERALNAIISRHEVLRSTIQVIGERLFSIVHKSWPVQLKQIDLSHLPPVQRESEIDRLLIDEPRVLYRLEEEPGIRLTLVSVSERDHILILMMHHIIADWSSEGVFWREFSKLYSAFAFGKVTLLPSLSLQHGDYATWQHQQVSQSDFAADLAFWDENLRGAPDLLELPADRPRPSVMSHRGARRRWKLKRSVAEALRSLRRSETTSLFTIFAAALNTLLYRYTGNDDILLGIPLADRENRELENVMGFLLHVHVLRTRLAGNLTFRELLARTRREVLDLYAHRHVPFDQVVRKIRPKRNPSYSSLFQVMLNWRDKDQQLSFIGMDGAEVESLVAESGTSKFDLLLFATDLGDDIWLELEYNTDLFDQARIMRMLGHFETLLGSVAGDPGQRLAEVPLLTIPERQQILFDANRTEVAWAGTHYVDHLIEDQAQRSPDAVAVVFDGTELTYRELNDRANHLAAHLRTLGVGPGFLAGICVERSALMLVGLLAILKTGGAYLPLDPSYPQDRLAFILQDAKPLVVLTQQQIIASVAAHRGPIVDLDSAPSVSTSNPCGTELGAQRRPTDLAYVLYTSGSTGTPKGVQIPHRAFVNLLLSMQREPGMTPDDTLLAVTTLSFDIAGLELFLPLVSGARVVIAANSTLNDGSSLASLMEQSGATMMQATPATWRLLLSSGWIGNPNLKILCGGEAWPTELADELLPKCRSLWNMYGPTETTIWSAVARVAPNQPVRIGAPIANTYLYILDVHGQPVPVGVPGELYIGGQGLASGYLSRPDLTAERFVKDVFSQYPEARMFRTGDLVRRMPEGGIEFLHRVDHQVKIRGYRIELGEIEAILERQPGVRQSVVVTSGKNSEEKHLAAYVVPVDLDSPPQAPELRNTLKQKLPGYMIPASFVIVDKFPLTPNGKIDRKALSLLHSTPSNLTRDESIAPRTPLEYQLSRIWAQLLGAQIDSVNQSFFDLGGHSLLAVRLISDINKAFKTGLTIPAFLNDPTIAGMADLLQRESAVIHEPKLIPLRPGRHPGTVFFLGSGVGICRLGQALNDGPAVFATVVPFLVSGSESPALEGTGTAPGLAEMASVYANLIHGSLDAGPCVLVGHSFTGLLAFEIGHQLQARGRNVDMIVLLDSWAKEVTWWRKLQSLSWSRARFKGRRIVSGVVQLSKGIVARSASPALETSYQSLDEMSWDTFRHVIRNALKGYRLRPLNSPAVLFRARTSHKAHLHVFDPSLGWHGLFSGGLEIADVAGDHSSLMLSGNLAGLAKQFQEYLNAVMPKGNRKAEPATRKHLSMAAGH